MKTNKRLIPHFIIFLIISVFGSASLLASGNVFNVIDYGALGGGKFINTKPIQEAIDDAESDGGGTVLIPPGIYLSGTLFLKDNVTFRLEAGATLLGSPDIEDYTEMTWGHNKDRQPYHLIVSQGRKNVTIEGKGTIDGNGENFWKAFEKDENGKMVTPRWIMAKDKKVSPLIEIVESSNVYVKDVTIKTGGGWNLHLHDCDIVKVSGINIINNLYSPNSDGIDITGCSDVIVSDCYIKTCDDAICIKTTPDSRSAHRITVTNCIVETLCVGLKLGATESYKDITDITMSNCVINNSSRAVGLYVREGATFGNINISNIVANTNAPLIFNRPIHLMVEKRTPKSPLGGIRNVKISDFTCVTEGRIIMTCQEGGFMENIVLSNITLRYPMIEDPRPMVEGSGSGQFPKPENHPGAMGARGAIVADNIKNLFIDNLYIQWPEKSETPSQWAHPERIENGSMRIHRMNYSRARQTEFSVLWGMNLQGGRISAPMAESSDKKVKKFHIIDSDIEVVE